MIFAALPFIAGPKKRDQDIAMLKAMVEMEQRAAFTAELKLRRAIADLRKTVGSEEPFVHDLDVGWKG